MDNRLRVYVRVKPWDGLDSLIGIVDDNTLVFDPLDPERGPLDKYSCLGQHGKRGSKNMQFSFDRIFSDTSTNRSIFETVTRPMVDATIDGFNCSVFAYGATGSGKTFTMLGEPPNNRGVIYFTTKILFEKLAAVRERSYESARLQICFFEIYNEKVRDLLAPEPNFVQHGNKRFKTTAGRDLPVRETSGEGLVISNLTYDEPENVEGLIEKLEAGNRRRSQHPTDANANSSRSHAIFQILLTRKIIQTGSEQIQRSKLSLIDLAGSERASVAYRAGRSKNLQREGGNINKSLLALGNCVNALADPRIGPKHIPYRDSKLTRLLRDSLGGKCRTAMIATVCQQRSHYDDTQNTLTYASRAMCIKLRPNRNLTDVALQPKNYTIVIDKQKEQILALQSEVERLKEEMLKNQPRPSSVAERSDPNSTFLASERPQPSNFLEESRYGARLQALYKERISIKLAIRKYESKYRSHELKLAFKQMDEARQSAAPSIHAMNGNTTYLTGLASNNNNISDGQAIKVQLKHFEQERVNLEKELEDNKEQINAVLSNMSHEFSERGLDFKKTIQAFVNEQEKNQELEELKIGEQYAYDLAQEGINRLMSTEDLLNEATHVLRDTYKITKARGLSITLESKLSNLLKKLEGKKSVIFKDDKYEMENNKAEEPLAHLSNIHDNFSLNFLTPFKNNNNNLHSRKLTRDLVQKASYTPEQSNTTFDVSQ